MSSLELYVNTLRYLRPTQIVGRAWYRLHRPRPDLRKAPPVRSAAYRFVVPIEYAPSLIGPDTFRFLNVDRRCRVPEDWDPPDTSRLWTYNLHYFDDLNARDAANRSAWHTAWLGRWIADNVPGEGPSWEPYPASRRIVNWVKWAAKGNPLSVAAQASLAVQARWLTRRLEYHLLGNHLLANAKALIYAGLYFHGPEADEWYARGRRIFDRELKEQILSDGGHFELSPLYHAIVLEDLLDLVNLHRAYGREHPSDWLRMIECMQRWLQLMTHPDGEIAFFNDAAFGVAPTLGELHSYCGRLRLPVSKDEVDGAIVLEASGYVRVRSSLAYLICDCGPVGPDHLPGHAHADTLSFELSLAGCRVLVNSGTSEYGVSRERQRQRGSAAHNTVVVDGHDSSEVWAGFRVARRARTQLESVMSTPPVITARHDGFRRLPGRNVHHRRWTLEPGALRIEDEVQGRFGVAEAFFHLHPDIEARKVEAGEIVLSRQDGGGARLSFEDAAAIDLRPGTWHPRFGVNVSNQCVVARFGGPRLTTRVSWTEAP